MSAFWKIHKCKLGPWLLFFINSINMKKFAWWKSRKIFLKAIFSHSRKCFPPFRTKIFAINLPIIGLENLLYIVFQPIVIQNYDVWIALTEEVFMLNLLVTLTMPINRSFFWRSPDHLPTSFAGHLKTKPAWVKRRTPCERNMSQPS